MTHSWAFWALLAAVFAALTAIFAKIGVSDINSNFATFLRTIVVVFALGLLIWWTGEHQNFSEIAPKTFFFLALSGLATGASWLCYFRALQLGQASQVAPVDKLSVVLVAIFGTLLLGEQLSVTGWFGIILIASGVVLTIMA